MIKETVFQKNKSTSCLLLQVSFSIIQGHKKRNKTSLKPFRDGRTDGPTDRRTHGRRTDGPTDQRTDGLTKKWVIESRSMRLKKKIERKKEGKMERNKEGEQKRKEGRRIKK